MAEARHLGGLSGWVVGSTTVILVRRTYKHKHVTLVPLVTLQARSLTEGSHVASLFVCLHMTTSVLVSNSTRMILLFAILLQT
jgi:hypothetical protein